MSTGAPGAPNLAQGQGGVVCRSRAAKSTRRLGGGVLDLSTRTSPQAAVRPLTELCDKGRVRGVYSAGKGPTRVGRQRADGGRRYRCPPVLPVVRTSRVVQARENSSVWLCWI